MAAPPNIVLVHGAWADGSCWSEVIERLQADGYEVHAPQLPETSLDTIEVESGHCAMVSHPEETCERIVTAAKAVTASG